MRSLSQILTDLIVLAGDVITKPTSQIPFAGPAFRTLAQEVRHADAVPADGIRTTRAALVMVIALEEFHSSDREPTSPWLILAGGTLPLLRGDLFVAMRNERAHGAAS